jgi:hypothetical protein
MCSFPGSSRPPDGLMQALTAVIGIRIWASDIAVRQRWEG